MLRLTIISLLSLAASAQNQCTSLASLVHGTSGAPSGLSIPDCSYIQANVGAICSTLASWDIVNADTCYLKGPGYGCVVVNGQFSTQETFYCSIGVASVPSVSASASASASATVSPTGSVSSSATVSPSGSASPSASATVSPTGSVSPSATVSPTGSATVSSTGSVSTSPTATMSSTATTSATATATSTMTSTATRIPGNVTYIIVKEVDTTTIGTGEMAAIVLSVVFFCISCVCGVTRSRQFMNKLPLGQLPLGQLSNVKLPVKLPLPQEKERRPSTIERERRPSTIEKERRPSQATLTIRTT